MSVVQRIEELTDVHFQNPPASGPHCLLPEALKCLMGRTSWAETIRTVKKVLFVDRLQDHHDRPLEDFVLQRRDPDRAGFPARSFRYLHPADWGGAVRATLGPV